MAVLYNTKGEDGSYLVIWGETDDDLCNYIQVEVRDEVTGFEESFLFRKDAEISWQRGKEDKVPTKGKNYLC